VESFAGEGAGLCTAAMVLRQNTGFPGRDFVTRPSSDVIS